MYVCACIYINLTQKFHDFCPSFSSCQAYFLTLHVPEMLCSSYSSTYILTLLLWHKIFRHIHTVICVFTYPWCNNDLQSSTLSLLWSDRGFLSLLSNTVSLQLSQPTIILQQIIQQQSFGFRPAGPGPCEVAPFELYSLGTEMGWRLWQQTLTVEDEPGKITDPH